MKVLNCKEIKRFGKLWGWAQNSCSLTLNGMFSPLKQTISHLCVIHTEEYQNYDRSWMSGVMPGLKVTVKRPHRTRAHCQKMCKVEEKNIHGLINITNKLECSVLTSSGTLHMDVCIQGWVSKLPMLRSDCEYRTVYTKRNMLENSG
jgi:hypothetical protein